MSPNAQIACAYCGLGFVIVFLVGYWPLAGLMPPIPPGWTAEQVAAFYNERTQSIRFGILVTMTSAGLVIPWVALLTSQTRKIAGENSVLGNVQLSAGTVGVVILVLISVFWTVAAFRPDRDPGLIQLANDAAWITFLMTFMSFAIQNFAFGLCVLGDKSADPDYPRWLAYFNFWTGVLFIPGGLLTFFKTGPFAWDGLFTFWVAAAAFFGWYIVMAFMLRRAILRQAARAAAA